MHFEILDKKRLAILSLLSSFKKDFYLAGGTALALQLGHRDSIDFDFFTVKDIETVGLFEKIKSIFVSHKILKVQEELNTLTVIIDSTIKLSFFTYKYKLLKKLIEAGAMNLASIEDIGAMKLSAVVGRSSLKDYIDLYFILQIVDLEKLLRLTEKKLPDLDRNLILKSLTYTKDITSEPIMFKVRAVSLKSVEKFIELAVRNLRLL